MFMVKALVSMALVLGLSSPTLAEVSEPRLITTTGNADVKVVPDEIEFTLGIETRDRILLAAKTQNSERLQRTLATLHSLGIDPKKVQTDYLSIEPEYSNNERVVIAYMVRRRLAIVLNDLSKFEALLSGVLQAGVNYVHNVEFRTTEMRKHRDRARIMAIQAAREKAIALAKELGQKVGRPHTITEGGGGWLSPGGWWGGRWGAMSQNVQSNSGSGAPSESGGLSVGQITISAGVTVAFELE
jgi:uncharacterized protein YggE